MCKGTNQTGNGDLDWADALQNRVAHEEGLIWAKTSFCLSVCTYYVTDHVTISLIGVYVIIILPTQSKLNPKKIISPIQNFTFFQLIAKYSKKYSKN